ncbi:MAG: CopG family transcriptional regulator [Verrucomicrobia bacterium]|nr:CopG family transcriptional regulator [Leptolyngbya sp. ES-bin-22]
MKADEFDTKFDNGEDITNFLDLSQASHPGYEQARIDVDVPIWMLDALDQEAKRLGVTRQAIIKVWLADRLAALSH